MLRATVAASLVLATSWLTAAEPAATPNFIVIYCDDLGYGDLACFGNPLIKTPNLDKMAADGQRWTHFYSPDAVCTPSRAGLLTGRFAVRCGLSTPGKDVLFPNSAGGLPASELTLAQLLKRKGYATACVGKWHLGRPAEFLPTNRGFDSFFGIPYSNDMDRTGPAGAIKHAEDENFAFYNVPLMRNAEVIERPADQRTLTRRYTHEAKSFIEKNRAKPFFLYLAHTMPHIPLFRSAEFKNRSKGGIYGDVIEELDASTGELRALLADLKISDNTLIVFTSDNGPWLSFKTHGGTAGPLRSGKGSTWDGGQRVPAIFCWPGKIPAGTVSSVACAVDIFPTHASPAAPLPENLLIDGQDLTPALLHARPLPRETMFFWRHGALLAVREGPWKAHFATQEAFAADSTRISHAPPLLFNLIDDQGESTEVGAAHPDILARLTALRNAHLATVSPAPDQLAPTLKK
jgi:arylsulfatase A-like enzyme